MFKSILIIFTSFTVVNCGILSECDVVKLHKYTEDSVNVLQYDIESENTVICLIKTMSHHNNIDKFNRTNKDKNVIFEISQELNKILLYELIKLEVIDIYFKCEENYIYSSPSSIELQCVEHNLGGMTSFCRNECELQKGNLNNYIDLKFDLYSDKCEFSNYYVWKKCLSKRLGINLINMVDVNSCSWSKHVKLHELRYSVIKDASKLEINKFHHLSFGRNNIDNESYIEVRAIESKENQFSLSEHKVVREGSILYFLIANDKYVYKTGLLGDIQCNKKRDFNSSIKCNNYKSLYYIGEDLSCHYDGLRTIDSYEGFKVPYHDNKYIVSEFEGNVIYKYKDFGYVSLTIYESSTIDYYMKKGECTIDSLSFVSQLKETEYINEINIRYSLINGNAKGKCECDHDLDFNYELHESEKSRYIKLFDKVLEDTRYECSCICNNKLFKFDLHSGNDLSKLNIYDSEIRSNLNKVIDNIEFISSSKWKLYLGICIVTIVVIFIALTVLKYYLKYRNNNKREHYDQEEGLEMGLINRYNSLTTHQSIEDLIRTRPNRNNELEELYVNQRHLKNKSRVYTKDIKILSDELKNVDEKKFLRGIYEDMKSTDFEYGLLRKFYFRNDEDYEIQEHVLEDSIVVLDEKVYFVKYNKDKEEKIFDFIKKEIKTGSVFVDIETDVFHKMDLKEEEIKYFNPILEEDEPCVRINDVIDIVNSIRKSQNKKHFICYTYEYEDLITFIGYMLYVNSKHNTLRISAKLRIKDFKVITRLYFKIYNLYFNNYCV